MIETQVCDVRDCREPARYYDSESDAYRYCWRHALEAGLHYFPLNHSGDQEIHPSKMAPGRPSEAVERADGQRRQAAGGSGRDN